MVAVDPTYLLFGHDGALDEGGVVIAECEGLPAEELILCGACLGTRSGLYGYEVLYTDTPFVGAVDTRLVGAYLSYFEHGGVHVGTHVLRSFVATKEMAYAMACAVTEGDAGFPHSLLSERIELIAAGATRPLDMSERQMAFEHIGVIEFGLLRDLASEPNGAGDVGRAVKILSARVEEQHTLRPHLCAVVSRSRIMHNSAIALVAGNRTETLHHEVLAHHAERMQLLHERPFGLLLSACKRLFFEPFEETRERHTILQHGLAFAFELHGILMALIFENGRLCIYFSARLGDSLIERLIDLGAIVKHGALQLIEVSKHVFVSHHADAFTLQISSCGCIYFFGQNEQRHLVLLQYYVGDHHGVELYIEAADIEQPCYLIEGRDHHRLSFLLRHRLADTRQFGLHALACKTLLVFIQRSERNRRTVLRPELTDEVDRTKADMGFLKRISHRSILVYAPHLGVDAYHFACLQRLAEPVVDAGAVDIRSAHELDSGIFELNAGLQVVTAVRKEFGLFHRYNNRASLTGKA